MSDLLVEGLRQYGLFGFVILSLVGITAWILRTVLSHFIAHIAQESKDRKEEREHVMSKLTEAIDRMAISIHESSKSNENLSSSVRSFTTQVLDFAQRNSLEHKDLSQMQDQILRVMRQ